MTTKTFKTRDSATSALRKIGIKSTDYNLFITKTDDGQINCNIGLATKHVADMAELAKPAVKTVKPVVKAADDFEHVTEQQHAEHRGEAAVKTPRTGVSTVAREMILAGASNQEVWSALKTQFNLDDSKKHYPTWYRCEMKRTGQLAK